MAPLVEECEAPVPELRSPAVARGAWGAALLLLRVWWRASQTLSAGLVLLVGMQEGDTALQELKILFYTKAGTRGTAVEG